MTTDADDPTPEPLPADLADQLAVLARHPGKWSRLIGWADPASARRMAHLLGAHPDARGYAFAVRGAVLWGAYLGTDEAVTPPPGR